MNTYKLSIKSAVNPDVVEKLKSGQKIHFIVTSENAKEISDWIIALKHINNGEATLSAIIDDPVYEEVIIEQYEKVGWEELMISKSNTNGLTFAIGGELQNQCQIENIIYNNGMTLNIFNEAYMHSDENMILYALIIHITDFRYANR